MKPINGYEGIYSITEDGKVFSERSKKFLKDCLKYSKKTELKYRAFTLCKNGVCKNYSTHKLIAEAFIPNPNNFTVVDHINRQQDDNRIENLRWVDRSMNSINKGKYKGSLTSKYKGVSWCKKTKKWAVYISKNRVVINLGRYSSEDKAAEAYNLKAKELYGEYAYTNSIINTSK